MKQDYKTPVYTIGITAKMLGVCAATIRIWEKKGLIKPTRLGKNRFYSRCDIDRLEYIKDLLQKERVNIKGVKNILKTTRCWEMERCSKMQRESCPVYLRYGHA